MKRLTKRILRRLWYEYRKHEYRLLHHLPFIAERTSFKPGMVDLSSPMRALPGNPTMLPSSSAHVAEIWKDRQLDEVSRQVLDHRLRIFSPDPFNISDENATHDQEFLRLVREIPNDCVAKYRPISWHKDFKSGYVWPQNVWYFDSRLAPRVGSDIKIPWELSRFVHVGILAHGDYEAGAHEFILETLDWIAANPRFFGINWASELVVAVRAINWIWALSLFRPVLERYPFVLKTITSSLLDHRVYLQRNLAYHELYSDDHYLGDLVGILYISAAFPEFPESDEWCLFALNGIYSEMFQQVLSDGYSQMMSSHYHRFVTELFVSAAALAERIPLGRKERMLHKRPASAWPYISYGNQRGICLAEGSRVFAQPFYEQLKKMVYFTGVLTKPNGFVPQFGDNDSARAHKFWPYPQQSSSDHRHLAAVVGQLLGNDELLALGEAFELEGKLIGGGLKGFYFAEGRPYELGIGHVLFPDSKIAVVKNDLAYLAVTCSDNGYHGKGGHSHNDKLSFELNVRGHDIIVDGGCPYYSSAPELRNSYRSTEAHNTLVVQDQEQDPLPVDLFSLPSTSQSSLENQSGLIVGTHQNYGTVHRRTFLLLAGQLIIEDFFVSDRPRYLAFNLAPSVLAQFDGSEGESIKIVLRGESELTISMVISGVERIDITEGMYSVGYGLPVGNSRILCFINSHATKVVISWDNDLQTRAEPLATGRPEVRPSPYDAENVQFEN